MNFIKKHLISLLLLIFAIAEGLYIYYVTLEYQALENFNNANIDKINSLIYELENRKDSIEHRIDTITIKISDNRNEFKEDFVNVSNLSVDSGIEFFTNYVSEYERRYSNNYNSHSIKDN